MKKREADFGILFRHWIKSNPRYSCACELKQTEKKSIPFDCLADHQIDYLLAINSDKGVLIRVQGTNGEPDYVYLRNEPAYVFVKYPGEFHGIAISQWIDEKARSYKAKRKSLTAARAKEIAIVSVDLTKLPNMR